MLRRIAMAFAVLAGVAAAHTTTTYTFTGTQQVPAAAPVPVPAPAPAPASQQLGFQYLETNGQQPNDALARAMAPSNEVANPIMKGPPVIHSRKPSRGSEGQSVSDPAASETFPEGDQGEVAGEYDRKPSTRLRMRIGF